MFEPTVNSYFCGAGLMDVGLIQSGIKINEAFELDGDAVKTYAHNVGQHVKQVDLASQLVLDQAESDGMVFTYPCTKYSTIADISGTRTGDELFLHALRHLAIARPEFYIVENVTGMRAFPVVMEAMQKLPDYYVQVFCPIKSTTWLPQVRDRLIIVGTRRPFNIRPPENTKPVTLAEIIELDPDVPTTHCKAIHERMPVNLGGAGKYRDAPIISDPKNNDVAPCAVAHYAKDRSTRVLADSRFPLGVRPYSVREYARLQGLPDSFNFPVSNTSAYKQIGNGVSVPVGKWIGGEMVRYMNQ